MSTTELKFDDFGQMNPCAGCPAPCCRMQLVPYKTPKTFMDIDHVFYMLQFPNSEMAVTTNGEWFVVNWETCRQFEASTCTCLVHNTPAKPRTCSSYNAHSCWYKRNFVTVSPTEIYRLDLVRFEIWVKEILFDDNGQIVLAPSFEVSQVLLKDLPIEPTFEVMGGKALARDIRLREPASDGRAETDVVAPPVPRSEGSA